MKKLFFALVTLALTAALSVFAFAATFSTPAEAAAGVTGKTLEEVVALRQEGKTYGTIASEAGKLEEFKNAVLEIKEDRLQELVKEGAITQAEADELITLIKDRQAACNGTGSSGAGLGLGGGRGTGGAGQGMGAGGMRLQDGSCYGE